MKRKQLEDVFFSEERISGILVFITMFLDFQLLRILDKDLLFSSIINVLIINYWLDSYSRITCVSSSNININNNNHVADIVNKVWYIFFLGISITIYSLD